MTVMIYLLVYLLGLFIFYFLGHKLASELKEKVPASAIFEDWVLGVIVGVVWPIIVVGIVLNNLRIIKV